MNGSDIIPYVEPIFRFCCRRLSNRHDAEDLASEIICHVLDGINKYKNFNKIRDLDAVDYIREYGLEPLIKLTKEEIKKGSVASTTLSGVNYNV